MKMKKFVLIFALLLAASGGASASNFRKASDADTTATILLEDFSKPTHTWTEMNDPVMGGKSTGTFNIENGVGHFEGEVVDVPFLHAPGFIQARTVDRIEWGDVSKCKSLQLTVKSNTDSYKGYRISFGNAHAPGGKMFAYGYKANLELKESDDDFQTVQIPFHQFTDFWDDATGDPIKSCEEDERYCPDEYTLKNLKRMAVWGEGVGGKVDLEIKTIQAVGCSSDEE